MSTADEDFIVDENKRKKFEEILKLNGIVEEVDTITMKIPKALKGQNMGSAAVYVQINFKDGSIKPKNFFVKQFLENSPGHTELLTKARIMEKETEFLTEFISDAREFCKKYSECEDALPSFPKCFYGDERMVVLENLVLDDSFVMLPKEDFQDLDAAKVVLTNLAKLHATTSVMLEEMGRENFEKKYKLVSTDVLVRDMNKLVTQMLNDGIDTTVEILKGNQVEDAEYALDILSKYVGKADELFQESNLVYPEDGNKFLCLNHGDCWNNNMLFKLDSETRKIGDFVFVDLQMTRLASPCCDISNYIYFSVKSDIRRKHLAELLSHYFDTFKRIRESFGKKCLFTFQELVQDFKRRKNYGFMFNLSVVPTVEAMKYVDVTQIGEHPEDMATLFKEAVDKWVQESPERAREVAQDTVLSIKETFSEYFLNCQLF